MAEQVYIFRWNRPGLPGRKGTACRVLVRSRKMNSCAVEFLADGYRAVVSRHALRKAWTFSLSGTAGSYPLPILHEMQKACR